MKNKKTVEKIKHLREVILDLSQSDFAKSINAKSYRTIQSWEDGTNLPNGPTLAYLEHAMKCKDCQVEILERLNASKGKK